LTKGFKGQCNWEFHRWFFFFLFGKRYFGGKAEIAHFDVHVIAEKEVSEFEVSMDNFFIMKVTQCFEYLKHEEPGLVF
jgi:hypothetical protein